MDRKFSIVLLSLVALLLMVEAVAATNDMVAYRSNTGSCATNLLNCPKVREWSASSGTWSNEAELATAGSPVREAILKQSPISSKIVLVTQSDDGFLDSYVCNDKCDQASSWVVSNNIGQVWSTAPTPHSRRFDLEFETKTGDAVLVYGVYTATTTRDLGYRVLPAMQTAWGAGNYIDDTGHATDIQYSWVELARDPVSSSEELTLVGVDSTDSDINAWVWSGSAWGNFKEITAAATATGGREALAVEYEADGGNALAMGGDDVSGLIKYAAWSGSAWSSVFSFDIDAGDLLDAQWLSLKADPSTDDLQLVVVDSGAGLHTAYSSGSTWTVTSNIDTQVDASATRPADFAWEPTGSKGLLAWDTDTTGTMLSYRACAPQCTGTTKTVSTYVGSGAWLSLSTNPTATDTKKILGSRLNSNFDGGSFSWDGSSFTNLGDAAFTLDTVVSTFQAGFTGSFAVVSSGIEVDALVAYRSGNPTGCTDATPDRCPRVRIWDADNAAGVGEWSTSEVVLPTMGGTSPGIRGITLKHSPVSSRVIVVAEADDGLLDVYVCNGACDQAGSWTKTNDNLADVASSWGPPYVGQNRFDVDFESNSGDALLVYAPVDTLDANDLMYVTLSATSNTWGSPAPITDLSGGTADLQYTWVSLARSPTSNEIFIAGIDSTDSDASVWNWDGSSISIQHEIATSVTDTLNGEAIATAWADDGSEAMAIVGNGATGDVKWITWTPSTSTWSSVGTFDVDTTDDKDVMWMTLKADPATDDLMAVFLATQDIGGVRDLHTAIWDGSGWAVPSNHPMGSASTMRSADFAWDPSGSSGKLVWDDSNTPADSIYYKSWTGSWGLATSETPYPNSPMTMQLHTNPTGKGNVKSLGLRETGSASNVGSFSWDGTSFATYDVAAVRSGGGISGIETFSLDFKVPGADAIAAYNSATGTCSGEANPDRCPKLRGWSTLTGWGSEVTLPTAGSQVQWAVVKRAPSQFYPEKTIVVVQGIDNNLDSYTCLAHCDQASSWNVENNIAFVNDALDATFENRGFDVEFETSSGDALLVWSLDDSETVNELAFKTMAIGANSWSVTTTNFDADTSADTYYTWVRLARNPSSASNEMLLAGLNSLNGVANAWVWDGSGLGNKKTVSSSTTTLLYETFAVAYAQDGSKGLVVASDGTDGLIDYTYWYNPGAGWTWQTVSSFDLDSSNVNDAFWITLKSDPAPGSDDIMLTTVAPGLELATNFWSGSGWTSLTAHDTAIDNNLQIGDFAWEATNGGGSAGGLVWETDGVGSTVSHKYWSSGSWSIETTTSGFSNGGHFVFAWTNPVAADDDDILGLRGTDTGSTLNSMKWTNSGTFAADTTLTSLATTTHAFGLGFKQYLG